MLNFCFSSALFLLPLYSLATFIVSWAAYFHWPEVLFHHHHQQTNETLYLTWQNNKIQDYWKFCSYFFHNLPKDFLQEKFSSQNSKTVRTLFSVQLKMATCDFFSGDTHFPSIHWVFSCMPCFTCIFACFVRKSLTLASGIHFFQPVFSWSLWACSSWLLLFGCNDHCGILSLWRQGSCECLSVNYHFFSYWRLSYFTVVIMFMKK